MAKKVNYLGNVVKEVKQTAKSASNAVDKYLNGNRPLPKGMKIGPSNVKKEAGQLAGAVLQGRRYDASGKQIVAGKGSPTRRTAPSTSRTRTTRGGVPAIQPKGAKVGPKTLPGVIKKNEVKPPRRGTPASKTISPSEANAGRERRPAKPMPKTVSPNAGRSSYRGGPLRSKKGM
jgi:hypothetical protein